MHPLLVLLLVILGIATGGFAVLLWMAYAMSKR